MYRVSSGLIPPRPSSISLMEVTLFDINDIYIAMMVVVLMELTVFDIDAIYILMTILVTIPCHICYIQCPLIEYVSGTPSSPYKQSRWLSESGEVDVFLLPGPNIAAIYRQYTALTGTQQLPPLFALGYHQCRWNYKDERDIAAVEGMFEQLDYPMDVLWLDIEHTDGKRYFTVGSRSM